MNSFMDILVVYIENKIAKNFSTNLILDYISYLHK